jgi:hypothetical protein
MIESRLADVVATINLFVSGVLWDGKGVIPGSIETIKKLKALVSMITTLICPLSLSFSLLGVVRFFVA